MNRGCHSIKMFKAFNYNSDNQYKASYSVSQIFGKNKILLLAYEWSRGGGWPTDNVPNLWMKIKSVRIDQEKNKICKKNCSLWREGGRGNWYNSKEKNIFEKKNKK